jgi:predicted MFS family arabinose efflux permease
MISVLAGTIAALPGAGIQRWLGPGATLRFAAGVYFAGAIISAGLSIRTRSERRPRAEHPSHVLLAPRLLAGGIATAASRAALGFLVFLLAFVLRDAGEGVRGFGLVLLAAGAGSFLGSMLVARARAVLREPAILLGSLLGIAVVSFAFAANFSLRTALIVTLVAGVGTTAARLAFDALVQKDAPEEVRGRTFARYETIFQLCWVTGAAISAGIHFSAANGFRAVGAICIAGILFAARSAIARTPRRRAEPADEP